LELQKRRLRRDLQKFDDEDAEAERRRAAAISAEESHSRAAIEAAQLQRDEMERQCFEEQRQSEADDQWREWVDGWVDYGLRSLPPALPRQFVLQVQPAIEQALQGVGPTRPRAIVEQVVLGSIQRAIEPWARQQEIENAVRQATQELPNKVRTLGVFFPPTEWEGRAIAAARQDIAQLVPNASFAELRAVAVNAGKRLRRSTSVSKLENKRAREMRQPKSCW
jgi:hypothetical protein